MKEIYFIRKQQFLTKKKKNEKKFFPKAHPRIKKVFVIIHDTIMKREEN
jgi:hypothetical protein